MTHNDIPRRRADHALTQIEECERGAKSKQKKAYVAYVKSLPAVMRMNGLGQALAMLQARAGNDVENGGGSPDAYRLLYTHVEGWFLSPECPLPLRQLVTSADAPKLLTAAIRARQPEYFLLQTEAALYVEWLKKFANAFLTEPANKAAAAAGGEKGTS